MSLLYRLRSHAIFAFVLVMMLLGSSSLLAQGSNPIDTVEVISQQGINRYECCHTLVVTNRHSGMLTISELRVRILSDGGRFINGQAGSPIDWDVFLNQRDLTWISATFDAEIDSGESLTSFRFCIRDTGVYRLLWETYGEDGLMSFDTLVLVCGARNNCDEAYFRQIPSSARCGFDIDLLNENGQLRQINDFHVQTITPGITIDTAGMRMPPSWRFDSKTATRVSWRTSTDNLTTGEFIENFRIFMTSTGASTFRLVWWTTSFGEVICRDTITVTCGLSVVDSLFTRTATSPGDACCRDLLLKNTHRPASPLKRLRLVMQTPNADFLPIGSVPEAWSYRLSTNGDTATFTIDSVLNVGDSIVLPGLCFDNDAATTDTVRYRWETEYDGLVVTQGSTTTFCRRDILFCDSISALVDSSLTATQRCVRLRLFNTNSRLDTIRRFSVRIDNPGARRRIVSAQAPSDWSIERITPDSVTFHRSTLDPGASRDGFTICTNLDTNALDPLSLIYTTWSSSVQPICTDTLKLNVSLNIICDSIAAFENEGSIDPLCCYTMTFFNRNGKGAPITQMQLRLPSIDLLFDTASAATGSWRVGNPIFPSISVEYVGDVLDPGDSVTFRFCVNAIAVPQRPFTFDLVWRTYSSSGELCVDTARLICMGSEGRCDLISTTRVPDPDGGCFAWYGIDNVHTPDGPIDNVQFTMLDPGSNFISAEVDETASEFDEISLSPKVVLFRGGSIPAGGSASNFKLGFDGDQDKTVIVEVCTFEGDVELCCEIDTISCSFFGVDDKAATSGLTHALRPNPSSGTAELSYRIEKTGEVELILLDAVGREVRRLALGRQEAGEWSVPISLDGLSSGVYYYELHAGDGRGSGRVVLVR